jgi:hypothetical protein
MLERETLISHMESTISFMVLEISTKCSFKEGDYFLVDEECQLCVFSNTSQDLVIKWVKVACVLRVNSKAL